MRRDVTKSGKAVTEWVITCHRQSISMTEHKLCHEAGRHATKDGEASHRMVKHPTHVGEACHRGGHATKGKQACHESGYSMSQWADRQKEMCREGVVKHVT